MGLPLRIPIPFIFRDPQISKPTTGTTIWVFPEIEVPQNGSPIYCNIDPVSEANHQMVDQPTTHLTIGCFTFFPSFFPSFRPLLETHLFRLGILFLPAALQKTSGFLVANFGWLESNLRTCLVVSSHLKKTELARETSEILGVNIKKTH